MGGRIFILISLMSAYIHAYGRCSLGCQYQCNHLARVGICCIRYALALSFDVHDNVLAFHCHITSPGSYKGTEDGDVLAIYQST